LWPAPTCPSSQSLFAAPELAGTYVDTEAKLEAERNQLADRERARFVAAGACLALSVDVLIRLVA
jgi:hypothetical protein